MKAKWTGVYRFLNNEWRVVDESTWYNVAPKTYNKVSDEVRIDMGLGMFVSLKNLELDEEAKEAIMLERLR